MKKLVTILCVLMTFSMLVSCGGQSSTTDNDSKKITNVEKTKETPVNQSKTEQINNDKLVKPAENTLTGENRALIWLELHAVGNMLDNNISRKGGLCDDTINYIKNSPIFHKDLKDKIIKTIIFGSIDGVDMPALDAEEKLKAVLKEEINKVKQQ